MNMNVRRALFILLIFILSLLTFSLAFYYKVLLDRGIDVASVNGFITASGIFLAAIEATSVSKSELLDTVDRYMVKISIALFFLAILCILVFEITLWGLQVWHLCLLGTSLIFSVLHLGLYWTACCASRFRSLANVLFMNFKDKIRNLLTSSPKTTLLSFLIEAVTSWSSNVSSRNLKRW